MNTNIADAIREASSELPEDWTIKISIHGNSRILWTGLYSPDGKNAMFDIGEHGAGMLEHIRAAAEFAKNGK